MDIFILKKTGSYESVEGSHTFYILNSDFKGDMPRKSETSSELRERKEFQD